MKTIDQFRSTNHFCITTDLNDFTAIANFFGAKNVIAVAQGDDLCRYTVRAFTKDRCQLVDYEVTVLGNVKIVDQVLINQLRKPEARRLPSDHGVEGEYLVQVYQPAAGDDIDYYDLNGTKCHGHVNLVTATELFLTDNDTNENVKLNLAWEK